LCENEKQIIEILKKWLKNEEFKATINSVHLQFIVSFQEDLQIFIYGTKGTKNKVINLIGQKNFEKIKKKFLKVMHDQLQQGKKIYLNFNSYFLLLNKCSMIKLN